MRSLKSRCKSYARKQGRRELYKGLDSYRAQKERNLNDSSTSTYAWLVFIFLFLAFLSIINTVVNS